MTLGAADWLTRAMKMVLQLVALPTAVMVAFTIAMWPLNGYGESPVKVLAVPYQPLGRDVPASIASTATALIQKEVEQGGAIAMIPSSLDANGAKGSEVRGADAQIAAALEQGRSSMEDGEFEAAVTSARQAIAIVEQRGPRVQRHQRLSEAYLLAGVALFRNGQEQEADRALRWAVHFSPDTRLDPAEYPPIFIRVFDRARQSVLKQARGQVEVAGAGGRILFDGKPSGTAPAVVPDVLPGPHWVRIEGAAKAKRVVVDAKRIVRVDLGDPPSSHSIFGAIQQNRLSAAQLETLRAQGRSVGASHIIVGGIYASNTAYLVRSVLIESKNAGAIYRLTPIAFDLDMLTAEVEVFKLAQDLRQVVAGASKRLKQSPTIDTVPFAIAPDASGARSRPPLAAPAGGKAGENSANAKRDPAFVVQRPGVKRGPTLLPKDEIQVLSNSPAAADGEESSDLTWLWITLGVLAAAGAGA
ncbi:MAG: hypothetical protein AAF449_21805, partial [Myxococcota bacterium]